MRPVEDTAPPARVVVTGMGIVCAIGRDVREFAAALGEGRSGVRALAHDGTQAEWPGALLLDFDVDATLVSRASLPPPLLSRARRAARNAPLPSRAAIAAAVEAWSMAAVGGSAEPARTALVVAGSNLNQRYGYELRTKFAERPERLAPSYAAHFLDSDLVGAVSEVLEVRGEGLTVGGASASGNVGLLQGHRLVRSGEAEVCVVVGALMELSAMELFAFDALGASVARDAAPDPARACRPFDRGRTGFVYGQASACMILEPLASARRRGAHILGELLGGALVLDGNRGTEPSVAGEARAISLALERAGLAPDRVDYLNAHGTASRLGDEVELEAAAVVFGAALPRLRVNSTKALTGHTLTAAGVVEAIATLIQMNEGFLHPNPNLDEPMRTDVAFVGREREIADVKIAMSNSFGLGGINTSVLFARSNEE